MVQVFLCYLNTVDISKYFKILMHSLSAVLLLIMILYIVFFFFKFFFIFKFIFIFFFLLI